MSIPFSCLTSCFGILRSCASVEASAKAGNDVPLPSTLSQLEVQNWLVVLGTDANAGKPIQVDVDLFEQGFDRLVIYPFNTVLFQLKLAHTVCHRLF